MDRLQLLKLLNGIGKGSNLLNNKSNTPLLGSNSLININILIVLILILKNNSGNNCNAQALGDCSHAEGSNTTASGFGSHAEGGTFDTTLNPGPVASGDFSHAEGEGTTASNVAAHAEGFLCIASGLHSHAEGHITEAIGIDSHAEGDSTKAIGHPSHAEGQSTIASGDFGSHAEGNATTASGISSHAEGFGTIASGGASHAQGSQTTASGDASFAQGANTTASGIASHAEGRNTVASRSASHAEGENTTASAPNSHAEGMGTTASGIASHAEGVDTIANGAGSHAEGLLTNTGGFSGTHIMGINGIAEEAFSWFIANGTLGGSSGIGAKWLSSNGSMFVDGAFVPGGADYAELFESMDGNPIDIGFFVTLEEEKIRKANSNDSYILGVISANPSIIADSGELRWKNKYITDEWGNIQYHEVIIPNQKDDKGNILIPEQKKIEPILNPEWDAKREYISRLKRPEWMAVGIIGKLLVHDDGTCQVNGYCTSNNEGIATSSSTGYRVIKRTGPNQIQIFIK